MERSIYEFPAIFRRVQLERPGEIGAETAFMRAIWQRHRKRPVSRVLDIACGSSPHGQLFARTGIAVVGIDRSPVMLMTAREENASIPNLHFYRRNIERFSLPERPFDAAYL
ncbi:MAG TPA: class I SAM-dependent methyltransferase, partial [Candidatus Binataceae bacterium]|nr:class I SAM-dependent methyltransferase [Candidatus Binataceae bacterium]